MTTSTHGSSPGADAAAGGGRLGPLGDLDGLTRDVPGLGGFSVRPVDPTGDLEVLHGWLTDPKSRFWLMSDATRDDVARMQRDIAEHPARASWLGLRDGVPSFLVEVYDPPRSEIADIAPWRPGDLGMHVLVAPTDTPEHGFTAAVMRHVMAFLFADPRVARVVVEPDVRNTGVHALNALVGFRAERRVALPEKVALLSTCTRAEWEQATGDPAGRSGDGGNGGGSPRGIEVDPAATDHLTPAAWAGANAIMVRKALAEFAHERLIAPESLGDGRYVLRSDDGRGDYRFAATRRALDHWSIDPASLTRHRDDLARELDAVDLVTEFASSLALTDATLPTYVEEIASTSAQLAFRLSRHRPRADELLDADFQTVEAAMIEGHPCFVANAGRLGLGVDDHRRYAPETGAACRLLWLGVHRAHATLSVSAEVDLDAFLDAQVGVATRRDLRSRLLAQGLDPDDYHLMPAHPWQWRHRIAVTFAGDVARSRIVLLGETEDRYQPQQSIRTLFDRTTPSRHYVKTALSIVNMGFVRGLSAAYMRGTPAINDWLSDLFERDPVLRDSGVVLLREQVAVGYHPEQYEAVTAPGSMYRQMLAALWRESPASRLGPDARTVTMASLLHVDPDGRAFVSALVERAGLEPAVWLRRWLDAYLRPLLHAFFAHQLVFMPHGENVILVLDDGAVAHCLFKDLAEEIAVMDPDVELPEEVERVRADVPEEQRVLSLFTDVFDSVLRHLAAILAEQGLLDEDGFWSTVAGCVADYQRSQPQLADAFARHDLFVAEFPRSCLNRLQLRDHRTMVDLADPAGGLQFAGTLTNPLARFRPDDAPPVPVAGAEAAVASPAPPTDHP